MRSHTMAFVGLWAVAHAIPTPTVEERQSMGEPVTGICVDADCASKAPVEGPMLVPGDFQLPPGFPTSLPLPPDFNLLLPEKRSPGYPKPKPPPKPEASKEDILEAEQKLAILQDLLDKCHDPSERAALKLGIKQIQKYLLEEAGIVSIEAPDGVDSTFVPGKRSPGSPKPKPKPKPQPKPPASKEDILEAEQKLAILEDLLDKCHDPAERAALKLGIKQIQKYLLEEAGIISIEAPDGVDSTFVPGKQRRTADDEDTIKLLGAYTKLVASCGTTKPSFATYMVLCDMANLLISKGVKVDISIIGAWSEFEISDKVKRQDGIFALPGTCSAEEVVGLQTALSVLHLVYGRNPSPDVQNLRNAIAAALQFCKVATPGVGPIIPETPVPGGPLVPEVPVPGGPMVPEKPEEGAPMLPEPTVPGGSIKPSD